MLAMLSCGRTGLVEPSLADAGPVDGGSITPCQRFAGLDAGLRILEGNARHARFGEAGLLVVTEPSREAFRVGLPGFSVERLAVEVDDAAWLGAAGAVLLVSDRPALGQLFVLDSRGQRPLVGSSCGHVSTGDGKVVFAVSGCDVEGRGTLSRIDVDSGAQQVVAEQVMAFSLAVNAERLSFVSGAGAEPGCFWSSARCELRTLEGALVSRSAPGCHYPVVTNRGDVVALHQAAGCADVTVQDLLIRRASGGAFGVLAGAVSPGATARWDLDLSPDHRTLLAQRREAGTVSLLAIDLDRGEIRTLATGVTSADAEFSLPLRRFTSSGAHVVFLSGPATHQSLRAVSRDAGGERELATGRARLAASWPGTEEVLFSLDLPPDLRLGDAASGAGSVLAAVTGELQVNAVTPDGRGVVFMESPPGLGVTLRYGAHRDGGAVELGAWGQSHLWAPVMDEEGCAVVFDTDRGGGGTWLVPLPR